MNKTFNCGDKVKINCPDHETDKMIGIVLSTTITRKTTRYTVQLDNGAIIIYHSDYVKGLI